MTKLFCKRLQIVCDFTSGLISSNMPYYCIVVSFILILVSYLLIKVWFIVRIAKLLLYIYVLVEALCGFGVTIWSLTLLVRALDGVCVANFVWQIALLG